VPALSTLTWPAGVAGSPAPGAAQSPESGNVFWYVKHDDGSVSRNCTTHGVNGCPSSGEWAG
jgi:hypothetical protein